MSFTFSLGSVRIKLMEIMTMRTLHGKYNIYNAVPRRMVACSFSSYKLYIKRYWIKFRKHFLSLKNRKFSHLQVISDIRTKICYSISRRYGLRRLQWYLFIIFTLWRLLTSFLVQHYILHCTYIYVYIFIYVKESMIYPKLT